MKKRRELTHEEIERLAKFFKLLWETDKELKRAKEHDEDKNSPVCSGAILIGLIVLDILGEGDYSSNYRFALSLC